MRAEKAWVWLSAGVLALGLNGMYQDGQLGWAHSATCRVEQFANQVTARGLQYVAMAQVMLGRTPEEFGRTQAALQKVQTRSVCQRVAMAQSEMATAQVREQIIQAEMQRKLDMAQAKMDRVRMVTIEKTDRFRNCPGLSRVIVRVPKVNVDLSDLSEIRVPEIQVPDIPELPQVRFSGSHDPL